MAVSIRLSHVLKSVLFHHLLTSPLHNLSHCSEIVGLLSLSLIACFRHLDGNIFLGQLSTFVVSRSCAFDFTLRAQQPLASIPAATRNGAGQKRVELHIRVFNEIVCMPAWGWKDFRT